MESNRPGYLYKDGTATAAYADNSAEVQGTISNLKIINDSGNNLEFAINRVGPTTQVDGVVKANSTLDLNDLDFGIANIAVKGNGAYRLWAYA